MKALKIEIPLLPVYLVQGQEDIYKIKELKGYVLPDLDGAIAKALHVAHTGSGVNAVVVYLPTLLSGEPAQITATLVHESCHAWDFIRDFFGYGNCSELHAYAVENIFSALYARYAKLHHKFKGDNDA